MTQKSKQKKKEPKFDENPSDSDNVETVSLANKILYGALGFGAGALSHRFAGIMRPNIEKELKKKVEAPHGAEIGSLISFFSLMLPEHEIKYFIGAAGAGATVDDLMFHAFGSGKEFVKKIKFGDLQEWEYIKKYSTLLHIDPNIPLTEKEQILLPYFPQVVFEQRSNPLQQKAIDRVIKEIQLNRDNIGLSDMYWIQQWFLYYGIYEGDEGLWPGHDRIRTLAKLLRVRDSGNWQKDGHPCFRFDCDDGANGSNQVLDHFGFNIRFGLISQKPELCDGVHPLHHIFPVVKAQGRLWCVETIKEAPIIPMDYIHEIFDNLQRVVIVNSDGNYYEYTDWLRNKVRRDLGVEVEQK